MFWQRKMKMTGNNLDERQNKFTGNAMAIAAILAFIYEIVIIIYTHYPLSYN